jgi:hypothetical protein
MVIPVNVSIVTTIPAINTPANIARNACLNLMPNTNAAAHPVHAPVTGSGTATNKVSASVPYFSNLSLWLRWVLVNNHVKNISKILQRLRKVDTGSRNNNRGITGIILPSTAKIYASGTDMPYPPTSTGVSARGMAPLNSDTGSIPMIIVAVQWGIQEMRLAMVVLTVILLSRPERNKRAVLLTVSAH